MRRTRHVFPLGAYVMATDTVWMEVTRWTVIAGRHFFQSIYIGQLYLTAVECLESPVLQ